MKRQKRIGLEEIGTHTMRKTFGYWHYQQYKDVAILQEIFNHSSPSVTLRYIGINQDNIDKSYMNFSLQNLEKIVKELFCSLDFCKQMLYSIEHRK